MLCLLAYALQALQKERSPHCGVCQCILTDCPLQEGTTWSTLGLESAVSSISAAHEKPSDTCEMADARSAVQLDSWMRRTVRYVESWS